MFDKNNKQMERAERESWKFFSSWLSYSSVFCPIFLRKENDTSIFTGTRAIKIRKLSYNICFLQYCFGYLKMVVTLSLSFILYFVSFRKEYIMIYDIENIPNKSSSEESYIVPKIIHFVWTGKPIEEKYIKNIQSFGMNKDYEVIFGYSSFFW